MLPTPKGEPNLLNTEISPDVAALVDVLRETSPGATVSYADLTKAIGRDIREVQWLMNSAQRIAAREHGAIFANERTVGYTRLTTDQLPDVGSTARGKVQRASRKAAKFIRYGADRANDVRPETQRKINAEISALALIEHVAADKAAEPVKAHDTRPEPVALTARRLFKLEAAE
jgi:hypothetical protein